MKDKVDETLRNVKCKWDNPCNLACCYKGKGERCYFNFDNFEPLESPELCGESAKDLEADDEYIIGIRGLRPNGRL